MRRRWYALAGLAVVGAALAAGLAFALTGGAGQKQMRRDYLTRVSAVCRGYARRLDRIPAPANVTAYGDVVSSIRQVLPLLSRQAAAMQEVEPPNELRLRVERLFAINRRSIQALQVTLDAAERRDAGGVIAGLGRFSATRDQSHALALAIGVHCDP
jgi:hypothetical protein